MSYASAVNVLPEYLVVEIQKYVDGVYLYIPRKAENKRQWGAVSNGRRTIQERDRRIYEAYLAGARVRTLAGAYYLSEKTVQRIIRKQKRPQGNAEGGGNQQWEK